MEYLMDIMLMELMDINMIVNGYYVMIVSDIME